MPLPSPKDAFLAALDHDSRAPVASAFVTFMALHPKVRLPDNVLQQAKEGGGFLALRYSYRFRNTMRVADDGVMANLSFGGNWFETFVPWTAVFSILDEATDSVMSWPKQIQDAVNSESANLKADARKKPVLHLVQDEREEPPTEVAPRVDPFEPPQEDKAPQRKFSVIKGDG